MVDDDGTPLQQGAQNALTNPALNGLPFNGARPTRAQLDAARACIPGLTR